MPVFCYKYIFRFDISVNNSLLDHELKCTKYFYRIESRQIYRQLTTLLDKPTKTTFAR